MPKNPNKTDYSGGFPADFDTFSSITDPRNGGHTLHHFGEILFIAFAGLLGFVMQGQQIDIDGKALRGSRSGETTHLHAVSAWACESGITLAQAFVGEKTNEITAIPKLLEMLNLKGTIVTIDAMGTQRLIAENIISKCADYILSVKGDQGRLHDEVRDQFDSARWSFASTDESGHDRTEKRQITIFHSLDWMDETVREDWQGLGCIIMVHPTTLFGAGAATPRVNSPPATSWPTSLRCFTTGGISPCGFTTKAITAKPSAPATC